MEQIKPRRAKIAVRIVLFAVISCIVLGVATILAGLVIYADSLQQVFISRARSTAVRAAAAVQNSGDAAGLSADVMAVYNSLTREERSTIHGNNERIRLEAICRAVEFFMRVMKQL